MRGTISVVVLALVVSAAACGGKAQPGFTRADGETVRKTAADLSASYAAKDVEAAVALFSPDAVFMPPNAPSLRGKDAIRAFFTKRFAENVTLRLEPQNVGGGGPIAFQSGTYTLTIEREKGPVRDRGKYLFVSKLLNGKWLFEQTMWSSDLPPQQ